MKSGRRRPAPSMVVALLALMVALGGGGSGISAAAQDVAGAAKTLISGKQVKRGTLTGRHVKDRSVGLRDLSNSARRALTGQPGPVGAPGPQGPAGPAGAPGSNGSDASIAGVPAGGDLAGTYPDPTIGAGKVSTATLAPNAVTGAQVADATLTGADVQGSSLTNADIAELPMGALDVELGGLAVDPPSVPANSCVQVNASAPGVGAIDNYSFLSHGTGMPAGMIVYAAVPQFDDLLPIRFCNVTNAAMNPSTHIMSYLTFF